MKPQPTLSVSVKLWLPSDMYIWAPFSWTQRTLTFWHRSFTFNSNKSPTWCNIFSVYYPDICLQLNMFRGVFAPIIRSSMTAVAASGFTFRIVVSVVLCLWSGRPAGPITDTARLSPRYKGKTRGRHCSHWAPDDGRENARNMLSCKQMSG